MSAGYNPMAAIEAARSYVGCPWRHRGRSRFGIDCLGLIIKALEAGGLTVQDRLNYGRVPWQDGLEQALLDYLGEPVNEAIQAGDIALIHLPDNPWPSHLALIARHDNRFTLIHSQSELQVCEHGLSDEWLMRIVARYRP